jgi:hypothetical protein
MDRVMTGSNLRSERDEADAPLFLIDPRLGDVEDDASSPKQKSLLAIAGILLAEISLMKLLFAWTISLLLPAVLLGIAPLVATAWLAKVSGNLSRLTEIGALLVLGIAAALGWFGWRPLFRIAEVNFWSLNALVVQPAYAFCREALRHVAEQIFGRDSTPAERARLRASMRAMMLGKRLLPRGPLRPLSMRNPYCSPTKWMSERCAMRSCTAIATSTGSAHAAS